jgi:hypothetical protein
MGMEFPKTRFRFPPGGEDPVSSDVRPLTRSLLDHAHPGWIDAMGFSLPVLDSVQEEYDMSPKQRRKFRGSRRGNRRPRDWTRWFREGVLEAESRGSLRLRTIMTGLRAS